MLLFQIFLFLLLLTCIDEFKVVFCSRSDNHGRKESKVLCFRRSISGQYLSRDAEPPPQKKYKKSRGAWILPQPRRGYANQGSWSWKVIEISFIPARWLIQRFYQSIIGIEDFILYSLDIYVIFLKFSNAMKGVKNTHRYSVMQSDLNTF